MELVIKEIIFWVSFICFNSLNYLINYIFYFQKSKFLPYVSEFMETRKVGLSSSTNHDIFRYSVELSLMVLLSRYINLSYLSELFTLTYVLFFLFNIYQFSFRQIYQSEPHFFGDLKLLRTGFVIVWHESKWKLALGFLLSIIVIYVLSLLFKIYLIFSYSIGVNLTYSVVSILWLMTLLWAIYKLGFYQKYPNDIYSRYHFIFVEIFQNLKRSITHQRIAKRKVGKQFYEARDTIKLKLKDNPPNVHFIFIESYGSYFYKEESLKEDSHGLFNSFRENLSKHSWETVSNFSESPTTGGQSWLTYSSMFFGLNMSDNTRFENYLHDPYFSVSNSLLQILRKAGYTNYNLNPIKTIKGINVPLEKLRIFYSIDRWILDETISYQGDVYGFGECPPDQYSMNFTMDLIAKEKASPYTLFYLTKNSHSPFIFPEMADNWRDLNRQSGNVHHVHKGFLTYPSKEDYQKSIKYQFQNLERFIKDHGKNDDIFLLMGDHQPPIVSNPDQYGFKTPIHVISRNKNFLSSFKEYDFESNLDDCKRPIKHEAMFSIFLRSFIKEYGADHQDLPEYEPDGLQL